jgi:hypothetical protein
MTGKLFFLLAAVLVVGVLALTGCGGGNNGGSVQLFLSDAPGDVESLVVAITSIEVHTSEAGWVTLKTYPEASPLTVDLLDYRYNGDTDSTFPLLATTPLTPGHYTQVRLMISSATVTIDGVEHSVDISNVESTGVKFNRQFTVAAGETAALLLDFNAGKSIVETGSGDYRLQPVTAMVPVSAAAVVTGTLVFKDGAGAAAAIPAGAIVDAYEASDPDTVVSSGPVGEDGTFSIGPLFPGTYTFKLTAPESVYDGKVVAESVAIVAGESKDLGSVDIVP